MTQRVPIHMGYIVADYISHQSQYLRIGTLFVGPYITWLLFKIGLLRSLREEEKISTMRPWDWSLSDS